MAKSDTPTGSFSDLYDAMQKRPQVPSVAHPNQGTKEATKEPSKVETKETSFQGTKEITPGSPSALDYPFNINEKAYRSNTYNFTDNELWALQDLGTVLERQYGIKANKYDLIRCGLHSIIEDFRQRKDKSF